MQYRRLIPAGKVLRVQREQSSGSINDIKSLKTNSGLLLICLRHWLVQMQCHARPATLHQLCNVVQVQFDADYESGAVQTPPVMFCTDDGNLCRADWGLRGDTTLTQMQSNEQERPSGNDGQFSTLLAEASSVNGFDIHGTDIVAVVEQECMCYIKRRTQTF